MDLDIANSTEQLTIVLPKASAACSLSSCISSVISGALLKRKERNEASDRSND
jgi:nitrate reductase beta subunit